MATNLVHPSIPDSHVNPLIFRTTNITKLQPCLKSGIIHSRTNTPRFVDTPLGFRPISMTKVAEQSSGLLGDDDTLSLNKTALYKALEGTLYASVLIHLN